MRGHTRTGLRIGAYVASGALALSGAVLAVTPAQAAPDPVGLNDGATWLAGEIDNGLVPGQFGTPDVGLSIDTALSLRTAGGHDADVTDIADAIEDQGTSYLEYSYSFDGDDYTGQAANATAKAMALFQTLTPARTTIGTINVQSRLESLTSSTAPIAGRIVDVSTKNGTPDGQDYANTLGQSFAAYALTKAGSSKAADAVTFLLEQQCSSGYFRQGFTPSKTSSNQSCVNGTDTPDADATAIAVHQLESLPSNPTLAGAISKAKSWLTSQQQCDGSFTAGNSGSASNANSTGLAAAALSDTPAARQAATWLRAHQATSADAGNSLSSETGAIAFDDAALAAGRTSGITSAKRDQWRRAAAQALPGLAAFSSDPTPAINLTAPTGYFKQGTRVAVRTTGAAAGTVLCVSRLSATVRGIASASGLSSVVTLPTGTATRTYTVKDPFGHSDTAQVKVLGAKTLTVTRTPGIVKRGGQVTVAARGLAAGETGKIYYGSTLVKSGAASASGNLVARFSAGSSLGTKSIRAYGRFTDIRKGATTVKVVR